MLSKKLRKWHQLVYLYSTIKMMHGPINIRSNLGSWCKYFWCPVQTVHKHTQKQTRSVHECEWDIKKLKIELHKLCLFYENGPCFNRIWSLCPGMSGSDCTHICCLQAGGLLELFVQAAQSIIHIHSRNHKFELLFHATPFQSSFIVLRWKYRLKKFSKPEFAR